MNRLEKAKEIALKLIGPFQIKKEIEAIKSAKSMAFMRKMIASPMVNFSIKNMTKEEINHIIDAFRAKKKKKRDPRTIIEGKSNLFLVEDEEESEVYARRISEAIVKTRNGEIEVSEWVRVAGGKIAKVKCSDEIHLVGDAKVERSKLSHVEMYSNSGMDHVVLSTVEMFDNSRIRKAIMCQIKMNGNASVGEAVMFGVIIDGDGRITLERGSYGVMKEGSKAKITLKEGSTLSIAKNQETDLIKNRGGVIIRREW